MATKDLSRTVIEGGRCRRNKYKRRASHGRDRASTRAWIDEVENDLDEADATPPPMRQPVPRNFYDKLAVIERWLAHQVGRPWAKVYAEICARFDTRTLAGRHIVVDHLLPSVWRGDPTVGEMRRDFVVDAHGILRRGRWYGVSWSRLRKDARAFAAGRRAASTARGWWWFRIETALPSCDVHGCKQPHHQVDWRHHHIRRLIPDQPLTRGDLRRLEALPAYFRDGITIRATWR